MENYAFLNHHLKTYNNVFTVLTCCRSFGSLKDFREIADGGSVPERDVLPALSVFTEGCNRKPYITELGVFHT